MATPPKIYDWPGKDRSGVKKRFFGDSRDLGFTLMVFEKSWPSLG